MSLAPNVTADLLTVVEPLNRFSEHAAWPAAVRKVHATYLADGPQVAEQKAAELVELFEDVFLTDAVS
ncbi:hypothetical protein AB0M54_47805 [Actinoplanes sp. NPDC051470]|uniref:hypothetical protein n=1 Tax=Actinoplanes sp. NPDC051470 TaxID=3157224 RepID=UPI003416D842